MGKRSGEVTQVVVGGLAFSLSLFLPSPLFLLLLSLPLSLLPFFLLLFLSSLFFFFLLFFFLAWWERSRPSTGEADRISLTVRCH